MCLIRAVTQRHLLREFISCSVENGQIELNWSENHCQGSYLTDTSPGKIKEHLPIILFICVLKDAKQNGQ